MVSNSKLNSLLKDLYHNSIQNEVGIDLKNLNLKDFNAKLKNCNKCSHRWRFLDSGLSEQNLSLYLQHLTKHNITNYCIGTGFFSDKLKDVAKEYIICFETNAVDKVESAIKQIDKLKLMYAANLSTKLEIQNIQKYRDLEEEKVKRIFSSKLRNNLRSRRRMWYEIDEGLRRILGKKPNDYDTKILTRAKYSKVGDCKVFSLHGDELRDLIRSNTYAMDINGNSINADVIIMGHFHLQMVMMKFNTLIIFSGCFVSDRIGYREEFLSHIGAPIFTASKKISKVCMKRFIPIEKDY